MSGDTPADGIKIFQPKTGFRYGAEAFWLVGFAIEGGLPDAAADLGTGSGIMAMLLGNLGVHTDGFDVRAEWEPLWAKTLAASRPSPVRLIRQDVRDVSGSYDLVLSNPPYFPAGTGPTSPDPWKSSARTEEGATLRDFVRKGRELLRPGGRLCMVLPIQRANDLDGVARRAEVGRKRVLLEIRPGFTGAPDTAVLAETEPRVLGWYAAARGAL